MPLKYEKTTWINGTTVLQSEHFEKIENGITDIINNTYTKQETDYRISEEISKYQFNEDNGDSDIDLSSYATKEDLNNYATKEDLNNKADKIHNHSYNELTNKPTIPTKTSQLTNDSNFVTASTLNTRMNNKNIWCGTKYQYEAITTKNSNTLYFVLGE